MKTKNVRYLQKGYDFLVTAGIKVINLYNFGSHVYGTADAESDWDYVAVVEKIPACGEHLESEDIDIHFFTPREFQHKLIMHDIKLMECYFNPPETKIVTQEFEFTLNKTLLRQEISSMMKNSWKKGQKKLTEPVEYDVRIALKSLFHSMKTCYYGIQIANVGHIEKFGEYNWTLKEMQRLASNFGDLTIQSQRESLWNQIETKFKQKHFNILRQHLKTLCPKVTRNSKRHALKKLFKQYRVTENKELINAIIEELD